MNLTFTRNKIDELLNEYQQQTGASRTWIANKIGVSKQRLSQIIKADNITLDLALKFSLLLSCNVIELFEIQQTDETSKTIMFSDQYKVIPENISDLEIFEDYFIEYICKKYKNEISHEDKLKREQLIDIYCFKIANSISTKIKSNYDEIINRTDTIE